MPAGWPGLKHLISNAKAITSARTTCRSCAAARGVDFNDITLGAFLSRTKKRTCHPARCTFVCNIYARLNIDLTWNQVYTQTIFGRVAQEQSGQLHRPRLNFHYCVADNGAHQIVEG